MVVSVALGFMHSSDYQVLYIYIYIYIYIYKNSVIDIEYYLIIPQNLVHN